MLSSSNIWENIKNDQPLDHIMNQNSILQKLNRAYFIRSKISNLPVPDVIQNINDGLCVIVFETRNDIEEYLNNRNSPDLDEFNFIRVGSIFDRIREFANLGYVGVFFYKNFPITFGNRISEYNRLLPTLGLCNLRDKRDRFVFGAAGLLKTPSAYTPWSDYSKSDKILRHYVTFGSGFQIDPTNTFFAIQNNKDFKSDTFNSEINLQHRIQYMHGSPLRKAYLFSEGATPIFSDKDYAEAFWNSLTSITKTDTKIIKIPNLHQYLNWLMCQYIPFPIEIGLNPNASRIMQGYFFPGNSGWYLRNIYGVFRITEELSIVKILEEDIPLLEDNVDQSANIDSFQLNLKSVVEYPLKRIFGRTTSFLSLDEAYEVVDNEIEDSLFASQESWDKPIESDQINSESYLVFAYDKISGNPFSNDGLEDTPYILTDIFEACSFFFHRLFQLEHEIRLNGYSYGPLTVKGAKYTQHLDFIQSEKKRGIKRLMREILASGYKPEHSQFLVNFINANSPILNILTCGYLKDMAIYRDPIFEDLVLKLNIDDETQKTRKIKKLSRSSRSKALNKNMYSKETRNKLNIWLGQGIGQLDTDSILMLESAISEFENAGNHLSYDYAGISMKLCKVFERELRRKVFESWRDNQNSHISHDFDPEDITLKRMSGWLRKRDKLDLGGMRYILARTKDNPNHSLIKSFENHIQMLPGCEYLLSNQLQEDLELMSTKYRNGGVHETIVTYDVCEEAFQKMLIQPDSAIYCLVNPHDQ